MWGPIKVWLLVVLATNNPGPSPVYFNTKKDCQLIQRILEQDGNFSSQNSARCVSVTVYVKK